MSKRRTSANSRKGTKEPERNLRSLFKPGERFVSVSFVVGIKRGWKVSEAEALELFKLGLSRQYILPAGTVGLFPGLESYTVKNSDSLVLSR